MECMDCGRDHYTLWAFVPGDWRQFVVWAALLAAVSWGIAPRVAGYDRLTSALITGVLLWFALIVAVFAIGAVMALLSREIGPRQAADAFYALSALFVGALYRAGRDPFEWLMTGIAMFAIYKGIDVWWRRVREYRRRL